MAASIAPIVSKLTAGSNLLKPGARVLDAVNTELVPPEAVSAECFVMFARLAQRAAKAAEDTDQDEYVSQLNNDADDLFNASFALDYAVSPEDDVERARR